MTLPLLKSPLLLALPGLTHGFTTRAGGTSKGPYGSLNLNIRVGDDKQAVEENRQRVLLELGRKDATWVCLKQVHGDAVLEVTHLAGRAIEGDALWTRDPSAVVAVLVADCVPVLMATADGKSVAAVHAGWRGTRARILARTVERLTAVGVAKQNLRVALGPAIGPCCFVIGEDVAQELRQAYPNAGEAVRHREDGSLVADLWALNKLALTEAGIAVEHIDELRECTSCNDRFFSHRRDHGETGRQAAVIAVGRR